MEGNGFEDKICKGCWFIINNINLINKQNELAESIKSETTQNLFNSTNTNISCKFCCGIFKLNNFSMIFENIKENIKLYDHNDYKITTNFSPLFQIIHTYWKLILKRNKLIEAPECDSLDISLIRKVFKPFFIPFVEDKFKSNGESQKLEFNLKSDTEVKIGFEFCDKFYDKIFDIFSYMPNVKKLGPKKFKPDLGLDKGTINEVVRNCSSELLIEIFNKNNLLDYLVDENFIIKVEVVNANIYLKGNYLKFSREIGQSPWEVNGVKICESSVQDEMKKTLMKAFKCDDCVMSAGGREDRDVRMLGQGRPFLIEIANPKLRFQPCKDIKQIEEEINKNTHLIQVKNLGVTDKSYYGVIKKYEDSKHKLYTCLVYSSRTITPEDIEKINTLKDLTIIQKTPIRVMHRRTLMDRNKMIYSLSASPISDNFMIVNVLASAGTYIKEFIHSDLGRTVPSMCSIMNCDCDILQLDVLDLVFENK